MTVRHTCTNQCDGCDTWCVEPATDRESIINKYAGCADKYAAAVDELCTTVDERDNLRAENERLKDLLCLADEALMLSHGCFPLDRTTDKERYLNDAAKAIRAVTGEDFHKRKASAAKVRGNV